MKKLLRSLSLLLPVMLFAADLKDVKSVYLYPMVGGLDQHLANQLMAEHVFRIVTDPKLADAIFTDQIGKPFEYRLDHIKRDPVAAQPAGTVPPSATVAVPANVQAETEPHETTFTRGKGTIFLVDAKSRQVVWSTYHRPTGSSSQDLNKTAKRIVESLTKTLAPPPDKS